MNRTIMEKARSMLLEASLPESFWAEAVNTAVYLHNRSPTRFLEGKMPYKASNGIKPDLSHLKVFGCDAFLHIPDEKRNKLQSKTKKCLHMGYVMNTTKMWRLWDIAGRRVIIGSNVRFDEQEKNVKKESSTSEENETSDLEVLQDSREIGDSLPMAIDDGPIGRFATGMPTAHKTYPDIPEKSTILDPEVVATNSNEDEEADESTDSR